MIYYFLKYIHLLGACVLIGTGMGIAYFIFEANRSKNLNAIASATKIAVKADYIFTMTASIIQPLSGLLLIMLSSYSIMEPWLIVSILLYVFIGALWLPVIPIQKKMAQIAHDALNKNQQLPNTYHKLFRGWLYRGIPAFLAIALLLFLMVFKPALSY